MLRRRVMRLLGERWGHRAVSKVVGRGRFLDGGESVKAGGVGGSCPRRVLRVWRVDPLQEAFSPIWLVQMTRSDLTTNNNDILRECWPLVNP